MIVLTSLTQNVGSDVCDIWYRTKYVYNKRPSFPIEIPFDIKTVKVTHGPTKTTRVNGRWNFYWASS